MSKVAVVYWSGTGNTEMMAQKVAEGAKEAGAEVSVLTCADFSADAVCTEAALHWAQSPEKQGIFCCARGDFPQVAGNVTGNV